MEISGIFDFMTSFSQLSPKKWQKMQDIWLCFGMFVPCFGSEVY